ncbi:hypothetical protein ACFQ08_15975 [Streptosporangium algeriense]|uniref:Cupin domain-containing protein n=1 Tax=Streptosporangium algeriense TaxID=1682748 RepID=A0ABW3DQE7_9ACTN
MIQARIVRGADGETYGHAPWLFKATGDQTRGEFDFMVGYVDYHSGPDLRVHEDQDDTFFVLEGVLTVQAGSPAAEQNVSAAGSRRPGPCRAPVG